MSRWWNEVVAAVQTAVPLPLLLLLLFLAATGAALLWYYFPAWVPRRWPRLRRPRWRLPRLRWPRWRLPRPRRPGWRWPRLRWPDWRRLLWWRRKPPVRDPADNAEPVAGEPAEAVPDLPAAEFASLADRLAAEGRYAEAVRERLRGMVRLLIERGVVEHRPAWTVTELAAAAAARRPPVAGPLGEAGRIFSDIWYGQRPAGAAQDTRMRELAAALSTTLNSPALNSPAPVGAAR
jgi:hypothetical protein